MQAFKRYHPISYLKTNAADVVRELAEESGAVVITEEGVPSFVCLSFDEFYRMQETNALVKLLKIGEQEIKEGQYKTLTEARKELDDRFIRTDTV